MDADFSKPESTSNRGMSSSIQLFVSSGALNFCTGEPIPSEVVASSSVLSLTASAEGEATLPGSINTEQFTSWISAVEKASETDNPPDLPSLCTIIQVLFPHGCRCLILCRCLGSVSVAVP